MRTREQVIAEVEQLNEKQSQFDSIDEPYFNTIIKEAKKYKLYDELIHIYCDLANIAYNTLVDFDKANFYRNEARKYLKYTEIAIIKARYYNISGNYSRRIEDYPNAIKNIRLAIELLNALEFKENSILRQLYISNYSMVIIYFNLGKLNISQAYAQAIEKLAIKLGDKEMLAKCFTQKSIINCRLGCYDIAEKFSLKAVKILKELNNNYSLGNAINQLGEVYFLQKKFNRSLPLFEESIKILFRHNRKPNYCYELLKLAENLLELNQTAKALKILKMAEKRAVSIVNEGTKYRIYKTFVKYYKASKNYKLALFYSEKSEALINDMKIKNTEKKVAEIEEKYQSALKQKEINFRKKKQREAERHIELVEGQNRLTKSMIELLNKGLKAPVREGKQMLDLLNRGGLGEADKDKIIKNIEAHFGQIEQFSKDVKEILVTDSKEALEEKLDATTIVSLVNKNLSGKIDEFGLDRAKYPKTYFIQEHVSRLAKYAEQSDKNAIAKREILQGINLRPAPLLIVDLLIY
jgi:tetratricopeptide (TPR) repeat protein